jgi:pimeloyl-ACP methyl ester carboxylesterase
MLACAMGLNERNVMANGIRVHCLTGGDGPLVVLLHGFPETHRSWQLQASFLVENGFRVVVPDLRGFGETDKPRVGYDLDTLADDVTSLIAELGERPHALVGHDWGAAIVWHIAFGRPELVERAVVLDCPPEWVLGRALRRNATQRRRSWYVFFFQLPLLPELWLARDDGKNLGRLFRNDSSRDRRAPGDAEADRRSLASREALRGPLEYYRAAFRRGLRSLRRHPRLEPTRVPVTAIWGEADACVGVELAEQCRKLSRTFRLHVLAGAGHFVHQERPDEVNRLLLGALNEPLP